jgi:hypothetical protein
MKDGYHKLTFFKVCINFYKINKRLRIINEIFPVENDEGTQLNNGFNVELFWGSKVGRLMDTGPIAHDSTNLFMLNYSNQWNKPTGLCGGPRTVIISNLNLL